MTTGCPETTWLACAAGTCDPCDFLAYGGLGTATDLKIGLDPILNHPGWTNDRHCHNGLWDYPNESGGRELYAPLAKELRRQMRSLGGGPPS